MKHNGLRGRHHDDGAVLATTDKSTLHGKEDGRRHSSLGSHRFFFQLMKTRVKHFIHLLNYQLNDLNLLSSFTAYNSKNKIKIIKKFKTLR